MVKIFKSKFLVIVLSFLLFSTIGCSSSGGGGSGDGGSSGSITITDPGIDVLNLSEGSTPIERDFTLESAGIIATFMARLDSFGYVISQRFYFEEHPLYFHKVLSEDFLFQPSYLENCDKYGDFSIVEVPPSDSGFNIDYDQCLLDGNSQYLYLEGRVDTAIQYNSASDMRMKILYDSFFKQTGTFEGDFSQYAESYTGEVEISASGETLRISADLKMLSNFDALLQYSGVEIVRKLNGEVLSASGKIITAKYGIFNLEVSNGNLILSDSIGSTLELKIFGNDATAEYRDIEGDLFGQYFRYDSMGLYDRRGSNVFYKAYPVEDAYKGDVVPKNGTNTDIDYFYNQDESIVIDMSRSYWTPSWSLFNYGIKLETMSSYRIFGDPKNSCCVRVNINDLPEEARPNYELNESSFGIFEMDFTRVAGTKVVFQALPIVGSEVRIDRNDEFEIYVLSDFDGDGILDVDDDDSDADGVPNHLDDLPFNVSETVDTDYDGIGDNTDNDIDGDGIANTDDYVPFNPLCYQQYSAINNTCLAEVADSVSLKGITPSGIVIEADIENQVFRYDLINERYLPPLKLSQAYPSRAVGISQKRDNVIFNFAGQIELVQNVDEIAPVSTVIPTECPVILQEWATMQVDDLLAVVLRCDATPELRTFHLITHGGQVIDSLSTDLTSIRLCENEYKEFYDLCVYVENSTLQIYNFEAVDQVEGGDPDNVRYFVRDKKIISSAGFEYQFTTPSLHIVGVGESSVITSVGNQVGWWDLGLHEYTSYAKAPIDLYLRFWASGENVYWYALDLKKGAVSGLLRPSIDFDGDGVEDQEDAFPTEAAASKDLDWDGYPDFLMQDLESELIEDALPDNANCWLASHIENGECRTNNIGINDFLSIKRYFTDHKSSIYLFNKENSRFIHRFSTDVGGYAGTVALRFPGAFLAQSPKIDDYFYSSVTNELYLVSEGALYSGQLNETVINMDFRADMKRFSEGSNAKLESIIERDGTSAIVMSATRNDNFGYVFIDEQDLKVLSFIEFPVLDIERNEEPLQIVLSSRFWSKNRDTLWLAKLVNKKLYYCRSELLSEKLAMSPCIPEDPVELAVSSQPFIQNAQIGEFSVSPNETALTYYTYNVDLNKGEIVSTTQSSYRHISYWYDDGRLVKFQDDIGGLEFFDSNLMHLYSYDEDVIDLIAFSDNAWVLMRQPGETYKLVPLSNF